MKNRYESAGSEAAEKEKLIMRLGRYIKRLMDRYKYNENKKVFAFAKSQCNSPVNDK